MRKAEFAARTARPLGGSLRNRRASANVKRRLRDATDGAVSRCLFEPLECRRMLSVTITGSVTLDESTGLQTSGIAVTGEDNNDNDVLVGTLPSTFSSRLFGAPAPGLGLSNAFATSVGVGK